MPPIKSIHGCSVCIHAGNSIRGSSISAALSKRQYEAFERAYGAGWASQYCTVYDEPVHSDRGKRCSSWTADS